MRVYFVSDKSVDVVLRDSRREDCIGSRFVQEMVQLQRLLLVMVRCQWKRKSSRRPWTDQDIRREEVTDRTIVWIECRSSIVDPHVVVGIEDVLLDWDSLRNHGFIERLVYLVVA